MMRTGFLAGLLAASLTGALCLHAVQASNNHANSGSAVAAVSTDTNALRVSEDLHAQIHWSAQGQGTLRVWGFEIYHASTWRAVDAARPFALQLRYSRAFDAEALIETTRDEWQRMKRYQAAHERWLERCRELWPDVRKGDTLTLVIHVDGRSEFFFNGASRGVIEAEGFGPLFADIWLGEKARFPALRQQLLATGSNALAVR